MNNVLVAFLLAIGIALVVMFLVWFIMDWFYDHRGRTRKKRGQRRSLWSVIAWIFDHGERVGKKHGQERSPEWDEVARAHRKREPACVVCGYRGRKIQVHHIKPFHLHPHLELDPDNLITLCEARGKHHHLLLGHLSSWHSYNEHVRVDAKYFRHKSAREIKASRRWLEKVEKRP
jgi:hypothetical protein